MTIKENLFDIIKFDEKGLIPAIAQDFRTGQILMLAWMNRQSLELTMHTKKAHYFSRSRQKLWQKGETSGQIQNVVELLVDCDGDALILKVVQEGVACHTGTKSCFFRTVNQDGEVVRNQEPLISSKELYGKNS